MALRLMAVPEDLDAIRALLLPLVPVARSSSTIPDSTIMLPSVGGRAEAIVIERLGADWLLFATEGSTIPSSYAQGDPVMAKQLVHDALVQFACAQLLSTGMFAQLVPIMRRSADQSYSLGVDWKCQHGSFMTAGYQALYLLRRAVPVVGRIFVSPSAGATGQLSQTIQVAHPMQRRRCW